MSQNQRLTKRQIEKIRRLDDFDLIMLVSDIHDHGWSVASCTLEMMPVGGVMPTPQVVEAAAERATKILSENSGKR